MCCSNRLKVVSVGWGREGECPIKGQTGIRVCRKEADGNKEVARCVLGVIGNMEADRHVEIAHSDIV